MFTRPAQHHGLALVGAMLTSALMLMAAAPLVPIA